MRLDSTQSRASGSDPLSPMQIAHHPLFTARGKIEMLDEMKIGLSGHDPVDVEGLGFSPEEIDEAINEVKVEVENGVGSETALRGDA